MFSLMLRGLTGIVLLSLAPEVPSALLAQGRISEATRFDVTSVKQIPATPGQRRQGEFSCSNGRFVSRSYPIGYVVKWAWKMEQAGFPVFGLPQWAVFDRDVFYDVEARAARPVSEDECRLMVRTLLADRFQLSTHEEQRTFDVYALVLAKNGPKIREVTDPNAPVNGPGFTVSGEPNQVFNSTLKGWTMEQLASGLVMLANLGRPVVDRTGLKGIYRIDLQFRRRDSDGDGPDVTTALRDQLGLELEARKEPRSVLVVDQLARPTPN